MARARLPEITSSISVVSVTSYGKNCRTMDWILEGKGAGLSLLGCVVDEGVVDCVEGTDADLCLDVGLEAGAVSE